jgi:hypothetical protein
MCSETTAGFGFQAGDQVDFTGGTFAGMEGRVVEVAPSGRVRVDLVIFGRPIYLEIESHHLRGSGLAEDDYLACCNPQRLVSFLANRNVPWSVRRVSLLGCACLRLGWDRLHEEMRRCIETAEALADQQKDRGREKRRKESRRRFHDWTREQNSAPGWDEDLAQRVLGTLATDRDGAWLAWSGIFRLKPLGPVCPGQLVHDIFGNPFRPLTVDLRWLDRLGGAVLHLARGIYDTHRFNEMPVLGDALEDAGCTDRAILDHCRGPGPHARGCWLLDTLLRLP